MFIIRTLPIFGFVLGFIFMDWHVGGALMMIGILMHILSSYISTTELSKEETYIYTLLAITFVSKEIYRDPLFFIWRNLALFTIIFLLLCALIKEVRKRTRL